jgi:hypothetical protein
VLALERLSFERRHLSEREVIAQVVATELAFRPLVACVLPAPAVLERLLVTLVGSGRQSDGQERAVLEEIGQLVECCVRHEVTPSWPAPGRSNGAGALLLSRES